MKRGEIWITALDPTIGSEMQKTRPCLVVSPDELNQKLNIVLIAPISSRKTGFNFRPPVQAGKVDGEVILYQMRSVDKARLHKNVATIETDQLLHILNILQRMFAST